MFQKGKASTRQKVRRNRAVQSHPDKFSWELGTLNHLRAFAQSVLERPDHKYKWTHLLYMNTKGMYKSTETTLQSGFGASFWVTGSLAMTKKLVSF